MSLLFRILVGAGLAALGYYVGREVGRVDHLRRDLEARQRHDESVPPPGQGAGGGRTASPDPGAASDLGGGAGGAGRGGSG